MTLGLVRNVNVRSPSFYLLTSQFEMTVRMPVRRTYYPAVGGKHVPLLRCRGHLSEEPGGGRFMWRSRLAVLTSRVEQGQLSPVSCNTTAHSG